VIAVDHDANGVGQDATLDAYVRWTNEGRSVQMRRPPKVGQDFNDVLLERTG
jgi:hypothetical protein